MIWKLHYLFWAIRIYLIYSDIVVRASCHEEGSTYENGKSYLKLGINEIKQNSTRKLKNVNRHVVIDNFNAFNKNAFNFF